MWKKSIVMLLSLLSSSYLPVSATGGTLQIKEPQQTITMSVTDWNELKREWTAQKIDLMHLRQKFKMLNLNSVEQLKLLETLKVKLDKTERLLAKSEQSLTDAKKDLTESKLLLKELNAEIREMEHKQTVIRRQRDVWIFISAGLAYLAFR